MNSAHALTSENLLRALPEALQNDESMSALATSIAQVLAQRPEEIQRLSIYPHIDELPEELLDILAYDFKVDWWDGDYTLEEKRRTLKDSWRVHRMMGTRAAVEAAISAIYPETSVEEWFEYGGEPYHFKLQIDASNADIGSQRHRRVLERVNFYKNLRSHLDGIRYVIYPESVATAFAASSFCGNYMRLNINVQVNGTVDRPHVPVRAYTAVEYAGIYSRMEAGIAVNGVVQRPHKQIPAHIGVRPAGAYSKITMEVAVNGLE